MSETPETETPDVDLNGSALVRAVESRLIELEAPTDPATLFEAPDLSTEIEAPAAVETCGDPACGACGAVLVEDGDDGESFPHLEAVETLRFSSLAFLFSLAFKQNNGEPVTFEKIALDAADWLDGRESEHDGGSVWFDGPADTEDHEPWSRYSVTIADTEDFTFLLVASIVSAARVVATETGNTQLVAAATARRIASMLATAAAVGGAL